MKSSSFTRASLSSILQPVFPPRSNPGRPVFCSTAVRPKPRTPLYLRPPAFRATFSELQKWHIWAKNKATAVGATFSDLDNGPDSALLQRELNWLVEDALENPNLIRACLDDAAPVWLRACLEELYELWKERIEERRPFQYVVGCEHWRDLIVSVEEGVLIPRPETEVIVDLVDDALKKRRNEEGFRNGGVWADLGTGSGALAIGIARVLGGGRVIATDLSPVAVAVASYNVQRYDLQDKIAVREGSWFDPLKDVEGELSGLVSNPPYIPSKDIDGLQAEVCKHEPRLALDGGANGMNDLLRLCNGAASMLRPGGFFAFETNGETQSKILVDYMDAKMKGRFCNTMIISDFAGIQRFVTGYRS